MFFLFINCLWIIYDFAKTFLFSSNISIYRLLRGIINFHDFPLNILIFIMCIYHILLVMDFWLIYNFFAIQRLSRAYTLNMKATTYKKCDKLLENSFAKRRSKKNLYWNSSWILNFNISFFLWWQNLFNIDLIVIYHFCRNLQT